MDFTDKALAELIHKLINLIETSEGNLPEIANQMLVYGLFDAKVGIVIGILCFIPALMLFLLAYLDGNAPGYSIFSLAFFIVTLTMGGMGVCQLYKINHAPKLYLIQTAAELIASKK